MPNFTQHLCFLLPSSRSQSLKMVASPNLPLDASKRTQQTCNQDSSSLKLTDQSCKDDDIATQGGHSQDQSISSDSGTMVCLQRKAKYNSLKNESHKKSEEAQMKHVLFMGNPGFGMTEPQVENRPTNQVQNGYTDPYFSRTAYGPQAVIQPHIVQIAPARVPLPLDLSEEGPIYVNAKQYHGILRRRQIRAKLEARNKLVKNRRPYLHESRHKHALNRVRGSGGRFLPTKNPQQAKPTRLLTSHCSSGYEEAHPSRKEQEHPVTWCHGDMTWSLSWGIRGKEGFLSNGDRDGGLIGR